MSKIVVIVVGAKMAASPLERAYHEQSAGVDGETPSHWAEKMAAKARAEAEASAERVAAVETQAAKEDPGVKAARAAADAMKGMANAVAAQGPQIMEAFRVGPVRGPDGQPVPREQYARTERAIEQMEERRRKWKEAHDEVLAQANARADDLARRLEEATQRATDVAGQLEIANRERDRWREYAQKTEYELHQARSSDPEYNRLRADAAAADQKAAMYGQMAQDAIANRDVVLQANRNLGERIAELEEAVATKTDLVAQVSREAVRAAKEAADWQARYASVTYPPMRPGTFMIEWDRGADESGKPGAPGRLTFDAASLALVPLDDLARAMLRHMGIPEAKPEIAQ